MYTSYRVIKTCFIAEGTHICVAVVGRDKPMKMGGVILFAPSCSRKWENTAFELVLRSAWGLSSPDKHAVSLLEVVLQ